MAATRISLCIGKWRHKSSKILFVRKIIWKKHPNGSFTITKLMFIGMPLLCAVGMLSPSLFFKGTLVPAMWFIFHVDNNTVTKNSVVPNNFL